MAWQRGQRIGPAGVLAHRFRDAGLAGLVLEALAVRGLHEPLTDRAPQRAGEGGQKARTILQRLALPLAESEGSASQRRIKGSGGFKRVRLSK